MNIKGRCIFGGIVAVIATVAILVAPTRGTLSDAVLFVTAITLMALAITWAIRPPR